MGWTTVVAAGSAAEHPLADLFPSEKCAAPVWCCGLSLRAGCCEQVSPSYVLFSRVTQPPGRVSVAWGRVSSPRRRHSACNQRSRRSRGSHSDCFRCGPLTHPATPLVQPFLPPFYLLSTSSLPPFCLLSFQPRPPGCRRMRLGRGSLRCSSIPRLTRPTWIPGARNWDRRSTARSWTALGPRTALTTLPLSLPRDAFFGGSSSAVKTPGLSCYISLLWPEG